MRRLEIQANHHHSYQFIGCDVCGAKCCGSHIVFVTFYDYERVSQHFPIFFYINNQQISLVYFFHNGNIGQKCHYLNAHNQCGIYASRPYACQVYPFENAANDYITADFDHCPGLVEGKDFKGIPLIVSNKINSKITTDFLRADFLQQKELVKADTDEFLRFCLTHQLLMPYQDSTLCQQHPKFASQHLADLYIVHQQKAAVLGLKYAKEYPNHYARIRQHLHSLQNIGRISQSNS